MDTYNLSKTGKSSKYSILLKLTLTLFCIKQNDIFTAESFELWFAQSPQFKSVFAKYNFNRKTPPIKYRCSGRI